MTIKELLAVLDLPKEEQYKWVESHCEFEGRAAPISKDFVPIESFADLAFRLRDEVVQDKRSKSLYYTALRTVFRHWSDKTKARGIKWHQWVAVLIAPIDRVVAALMVKEAYKKKGEK